MRTCLFWGSTKHARTAPRAHRFSYPLFHLCLELSELNQRAHASRVFGYNRRRVLSIRDTDYINAEALPIAEKHAQLLSLGKGEAAPLRTFLITMPRFFGYAFNPVSFYVSFDKSDALHTLIAEVNNTFGEKHIYVLPAQKGTHTHDRITFSFPKEFYVSPFLPPEGEYQLTYFTNSDSLKIAISFSIRNEQVFYADLEGVPRELNDRQLLLSLLRFPFAIILTMTRIHLQALKLFFFREAIPYAKEQAPSHGDSRGALGFWPQLRLRALNTLIRLRRIRIGSAVSWVHSIFGKGGTV